MGQALLPEHFYAQEQSIREEVNLRFRMQEAPCWGLGTLQWDNFQLLKGIVSVDEMTLFLQSGVLIDIPGNTAPAFLNLNASGATKSPLYVHLQSGFNIVSVAQGELAEEGIERIVQKIELSTNPYSETAAQSFKLAEFECGADGAWSLRSSYLPPLLQVGASPFFDSYVQRLNGIVRTVRQVLMDEIQDNYLAAGNQGAAKQCLRGLYGLQALLVDLQNEIRPHPYEVFRAVRDLYVDVCIFRSIEPVEVARAYTHEDLAGCFTVLLEAVEQLVQTGHERVPYVEFVRREGMLVCELSKEAKRAQDVFLLIQKPQISTKLELGRVKLASASRLNSIYERALRGIPFQRIDNPPFQHGLSATVEFYAISPGQEWDFAVREGSVVLFDAPALQGCRLYLYSR